MKFPLALKVSLLLIANLIILIALGTGWFFFSSANSGQSLVKGPLGDRVQVLADSIYQDLREAPIDEQEELIAALSEAHGADILWMRNDGLVLAGPSLPIPEEVRRELTRNAQGPNPLNRGRPDRFEGPPPQRLTPPGNKPGRFLVQSAASDGYWFGLRLIPERSQGGPPRRRPNPTTLLIRVDSIWGLAQLFGLHIWAGVAAIAMGVSILFWLPFAQSASRRLARLTQATEAIAEGRFDVRAGISGRDEINRLGDAVDTMAGRLDTMVNGQKRFLGDVAHELGSPIARLQLAIEIIEQRAGSDLKESIVDARDEVQHMSALVHELLAFTKAGMQPRDAELSSVELAPLVAQVIAREDPFHRIDLRITDQLTARADGPLLSRAIANLVRNALRYAGDSAAITLTASQRTDHVQIIIEDDGPGVPAESLARLGEPFYRPELARTREGGGVGLGLAIVRSAITASGGEVRFSNREPHGFHAEIILKNE
jgi:two-component system, OmpR family, sensor histidine kinase CpxA